MSATDTAALADLRAAILYEIHVVCGPEYFAADFLADAIALRVLTNSALASRLTAYAVHDEDCTVNRYPGHDACSCGLSAVLQEARHRSHDILGEAT